MKDFQQLKVWQKAHALVVQIYDATGRFPQEERYGLSNQMRRAAVSISCNIAEGCGRRGDGEFHRFLEIAAGSASELYCQLLIARDLKFMRQENFQELSAQLEEVRRMLSSLATKVDVDRLRASAATAGAKR